MITEIKVGYTVTVPDWPKSGELTVVEEHGEEVTLSNGRRIYKAKCVLNWRKAVADRKKRNSNSRN